MKERNGFVSNSSSSSFCIYGTYIRKDEMVSLYQQLAQADMDDGYEVAEAMAKEMGVEFFTTDYDYSYYFGESLTNMKDDETMGKFKEKIIVKMARYFPDKSKFGYLEEAWYNG